MPVEKNRTEHKPKVTVKPCDFLRMKLSLRKLVTLCAALDVSTVGSDGQYLTHEQLCAKLALERPDLMLEGTSQILYSLASLLDIRNMILIKNMLLLMFYIRTGANPVSFFLTHYLRDYSDGMFEGEHGRKKQQKAHVHENIVGYDPTVISKQEWIKLRSGLLSKTQARYLVQKIKSDLRSDNGHEHAWWKEI